MRIRILIGMCCMALVIFTAGCASLDLRVDQLRLHGSYGTIRPRVEITKFEYFTGEPDPSYTKMVTGKSDTPYIKLAEIIVQEQPTVIVARATDQMIRHLCKLAWAKGADAVINVTISTTSVAGGYARTSPVVKGTAIRYED